jgi:hypothetical protein
MGLKSFKTDSSAMSDGIWVDLPDNADGSTPAVRLRGNGSFDDGYTKALRAKMKPYAKVFEFESERNTQIKERLVKEVVCEYVIADWRNMQPNDDGQELAFNIDNVKQIVFDPEYRPFLNFVLEQSSDYEKFNRANLEATAKN